MGLFLLVTPSVAAQLEGPVEDPIISYKNINDEAPTPDYDGTMYEDNVLAVSATFGTVLLWDSRASPYTRVQISPVLVSATGYALVSPAGKINPGRTSDSLGVVHFPHVELQAGPHTLQFQPVSAIGSGPAQVPPMTVASFFVTPEMVADLPPAPPDDSVNIWTPGGESAAASHGEASAPMAAAAESASGSGDCEDPGPRRYCGPTECPAGSDEDLEEGETYKHFPQVQTFNRWYPLIAIHAPYAGSATVDGSWETAKSWMVFASGRSEVASHAFKIDTTNGVSWGYFQFVKFAIHAVKCVRELADGQRVWEGEYRCPCFAAVVDWNLDSGGGKRLKGFSYFAYQSTDQDDYYFWETRFGEQSVTNHIEMTERNGVHEPSPGTVHYSTSSRVVQMIGGSVSVERSFGLFSFGATVMWKSDKQLGAYFHYELPPNRFYIYDHLGADPESALAFCYPFRDLPEEPYPGWVCNCRGLATAEEQAYNTAPASDDMSQGNPDDG